MTNKLVAVVLVVALALPLAALAQEEGAGPITWIAYSKVKSGKTRDAVALTLRDKEFYDGLLADGTILSWGITTPVNHRPSDNWNHAVWVTVESWEKIGAWTGAFGARMGGFDEAEHMSRQEAAEAAYQPNSHHDAVVRHVHFRPPADGGPKPAYFLFGNYTAHPGQEGALTKLYKDLVPGIVDPLQVDGTVLAYGLYVSELHGDDWTHGAWYALPSLGAMDKLTAAIEAAVTPEIVATMGEITDTTAHYDTVSMVLHIGEAGGDSE